MTKAFTMHVDVVPTRDSGHCDDHAQQLVQRAIAKAVDDVLKGALVNVRIEYDEAGEAVFDQ